MVKIRIACAYTSSTRSSRPTAVAALRKVLNVTASYSGSSKRSSAARLVETLIGKAGRGKVAAERRGFSSSSAVSAAAAAR